MTTEIEKDTARSQARAQYESILSLLNAMTLEGAARAWLADKTQEDIFALWQNCCDDGTGDEPDLEEATEALQAAIEDGLEPGGFTFSEDNAREALEADALSVEVRSGWYLPFAPNADKAPAEFRICLATGGPAVQIRGEIDSDGEPSRAWLEYQDWYQPWQQWHGEPDGICPDQDKLLEYARHFICGDLFAR